MFELQIFMPVYKSGDNTKTHVIVPEFLKGIHNNSNVCLVFTFFEQNINTFIRPNIVVNQSKFKHLFDLLIAYEKRKVLNITHQKYNKNLSFVLLLILA